MEDELLRSLVHRVRDFELSAHDLLARQGVTTSRVLSLTDTYKQLTILNLKQNELFEESLKSMENSLHRPGVVMAWAGFIDFLQEKMTEDQFAKLHAAYPKWGKWSTLEELRENVTEFAVLDAAQRLGVLTKAEMKALHGLLSKRNECAHPSGYKPTFDEALGYVSELLNRIPTISQRSL